MMVEHASSVVSTMILVYWQPTGLFEFGTALISTPTVSWAALALIAQMIPEVISDTWCVWCECQAGMGALALRYWSRQFGWKVFGLKCITVINIVTMLVLVKLNI